MAEIILSTFTNDAWIEVDTARGHHITVSVHIELDDREKVAALVGTLNEWLRDTSDSPESPDMVGVA